MRKMMVAGLCVVALLMAVPAAGDDVVGSEKEMRTLDCPVTPEADADLPEWQQPPDRANGDCKDDPSTPDVDESQGTYEGWVWTNEVTCHSTNQDVAAGVSANAVQSGTGGEMGLCSDGELPIRGRLVMGGSVESGGLYLYVDGVDGNPEPADGWARLDAQPAGGDTGLRCGSSDGRRDASEPTASDTQDECG